MANALKSQADKPDFGKEIAVLSTILILLCAAIHGYFLWLEMFQWEAPRTRAVFATSPEFAAASKALAANQGLYNGFLAAGLLFGLWRGDTGMLAFLLLCIVVAGIYGALTATKAAFFAQTIPAGAALLVLWL
jgi:putative membrane protein